jgi:hypothetical protein
VALGIPQRNKDDRTIMAPTLDEYCHCPHCNRRTRHSVARERVLAPVLWCLSCFRTRIETVAPKAKVKVKVKALSRRAKTSGADQPFHLAG